MCHIPVAGRGEDGEQRVDGAIGIPLREVAIVGSVIHLHNLSATVEFRIRTIHVTERARQEVCVVESRIEFDLFFFVVSFYSDLSQCPVPGVG